MSLKNLFKLSEGIRNKAPNTLGALKIQNLCCRGHTSALALVVERSLNWVRVL